MNFLAHAYLAGPDPGVLTGSLIADFVKGHLSRDRFPDAVRRGVRLHRKIDSFTDQHAVVRQSIDRVRGRVGPYCGAVVDVLYDHILARDFELHAGQSLAGFVAQAEDAFILMKQTHPELLQPRWTTISWLADYATTEGIGRSLDRLSSRTRGRLNATNAMAALTEHNAQLTDDFSRFFPDVVAYANDQRS